MAKFFFRNAPNTIKDAIELSEQEFLTKYSETTATEDVLKNAYYEIRKNNPQASKEVTFKVVPTGENVVPFVKPEEKENDGLTESERQELAELEAMEKVSSHKEVIENDMLVAQRTVDTGEMLADASDEIQLPENVTFEPVSHENLQAGDSDVPAAKEKRNRGRQRLSNADKRDARMQELIKEGKKGQYILKTMKEEGFTVHAPQISNMKKKLEGEKKQVTEEVDE